MTEIQTEIEIAASAERVWQVLTDFRAYPHWTDFMQPLNGNLQVGARLIVRIYPWLGLPISFRALVLRADPGRELRWQGVLLLSSLFRGEHSFLIEPLGEHRVKFAQRETYSGLLAPFLMLLLKGRNRRGFEKMNRDLQARAEHL